MTMTFKTAGLVLGAMSALVACGGSGTPIAVTDPDTVVTPAFADLTSQATTALAAVSLDSAARTTSGLTGTLNRSANTASIGALSGAINADRSIVTLTGGGTVTIQAGGNLYSARYVATPTGGNRTLGIIGAPTAGSALPTGTATMKGSTGLALQDGTTLYDLTGDAVVAANFGTNRVITTLSALEGTQTNGITATANVSNVGTVTISNSVISGSKFEGGTISLNVAGLSPIGANPTTSVNGAFFGPSEQEAGGVFVLDDTATGNVRIFGDFIAKSPI